MFNNHTKAYIPITISVIFTLLVSLMYLSNNGNVKAFLQRIEAISYDYRLRLSIPIQRNDVPPIAIIDIDEASLKQEGQWPWSRIKLAQLITKLSQHHVAVIAVDIVQSEKEENPTRLLKAEIKQKNYKLPVWFDALTNTLDADTYFSKAINGKEVILGYAFHKTLDSQTGLLPNTPIENTGNNELLTTFKMKGYTANLNAFTEHAASGGFFSITPDSDGIVRRAPIIVSHNNSIYPSLALETARLYLLEDAIALQTAKIGTVNTITGIALGESIIPTDENGRILIPYLAEKKYFPYYSATQILRGNREIPELENAVVFIGTSAVGLVDLRPTPVQAGFPGVEIQATILHGILHPKTMTFAPDWTDGATVSLLVVLGVLMLFFYPWLQPLKLILFGVTLFIVTFSMNYWLWKFHQIHLPLVIPLFLIVLVSSLFIINNLLVENKQRRRIHNMFGQYVPIKHIDMLIENGKRLSMDGEKREMSVMFSDIRNFTALSEPLATQELKAFLNQYLTPITEIIFKHQGTIDKYVGDLVMAFWGAPIENKNHASLSIKTALAMQAKITDMQEEFIQLGISKIEAGIGVHTGEMNVGDMGSDYRRAYTVLGDAVNLGSRLESLTKFYGVKILTSENTKLQCADIVFRYIDYVKVKGKQDAIKIYEPIDQVFDFQKVEQLEKHELAFKHYLAGNWEAAKELLIALQEITGEHLYSLYLERMEVFDKTTLKDWDGVYTHLSK